MRIRIRANNGQGEKGFALIMVLLGILLLSAVAASVAYLSMNENKVSGSDIRANQTEYAAEAALEKLTAELDNLYQGQQSPSVASIQALANDVPASADFSGIANVTWNGSISFPGCDLSGGRTTPCSGVGTIPSGVNQGLQAVIVPMQLQVTAQLATGTTVNLTRQVEMALVPVFQFGIFSNMDTAFFAGPDYTFGGKIHTNGNLYLLEGNNHQLVLTDKTSAYLKIIRDYLPNGESASASNHTGTVLAPTQATGCGTGSGAGAGGSSATCRFIGLTTGTCNSVSDYPEGSWKGGVPTGAGAVNGNWTAISKTCYHSYLVDGTTGAKNQNLAFVTSGIKPFEIIRQPTAGESPTSAIGGSRLYNMATVRIFLADTVNELPYDQSAYTSAALDPNNVPINIYQGSGALPYNPGNGGLANGTTCYFWPPGTGSNLATLPISATTNCGVPTLGTEEYFAMGKVVRDPVGSTTECGGTVTIPGVDADWQSNSDAGGNNFIPNWGRPVANATPTASPFPTPAPVAGATPFTWTCAATPRATPVYTYTFPLVQGWLRVDLQTQDNTGQANVDASGNPIYTGVTWQWLNLGFSRGVSTTTGGSGNNPIPSDSKAILILQEWADRADSGTDPGYTAANTRGPATQFNWYPVNFYDAREGELRDIAGDSAIHTGHVLGVMNAVELDVANLKAWLSAMNTGSQTAAAGCHASGGALPLVTGEPACPSATPSYQKEHGYILYFSDRRHMVPSLYASSTHVVNEKNGESGLEDIVNPGNANGAPDNTLETGEDVDQNGQLDNWGRMNIAGGFPGTSASFATASDITQSVNMIQVGRKYAITGPRHVLRLINGGYPSSNTSLPVSPGGGGFTVASENPVYIWRSYNADNTLVPGDNTTDTNSAPAAIIADAVTLLSDAWNDKEDNDFPIDSASRLAVSSYYRVAIAAGKNMNFPYPGGSGGAFNTDFGTDGGMHNFLRLLERWGSNSCKYEGSMVSLYYSQYAVGVYKSGGAVYGAPNRNFQFDMNFTDLTKLPPGTPSFKDVNNTGFSQNFAPQ